MTQTPGIHQRGPGLALAGGAAHSQLQVAQAGLDRAVHCRLFQDKLRAGGHTTRRITQVCRCPLRKNEPEPGEAHVPHGSRHSPDIFREEGSISTIEVDAREIMKSLRSYRT